MENIPYLKAFLSTPVWAVLDYLLQHPDLEETDTEISRSVGRIKKSAVNVALRELSSLGIVDRRERGNMVINRLIDTPLICQLKIVSNLMHIQPFVDKLKANSFKVVLFGSRANGSHTSDSDFDLFVVANDPLKIKVDGRYKIQMVIKRPEQMLSFKGQEPALFSALKKGIVLWERI